MKYPDGGEACLSTSKIESLIPISEGLNTTENSLERILASDTPSDNDNDDNLTFLETKTKEFFPKPWVEPGKLTFPVLIKNQEVELPVNLKRHKRDIGWHTVDIQITVLLGMHTEDCLKLEKMGLMKVRKDGPKHEYLI